MDEGAQLKEETPSPWAAPQMHSSLPAAPVPAPDCEAARNDFGRAWFSHASRQLHDLAERLERQQEIGNGELYRILAELQMHRRPAKSA